jgi:PIN domain nuclease of toxin-antitoxin system
MRILLDTHIWIWYQEGNERLSSSLRKLIESDENLLYLSPISIWETLILGEKKRVLLEPTPEDWVRDSLAQLEVIEVPLSWWGDKNG